MRLDWTKLEVGPVLAELNKEIPSIPATLEAFLKDLHGDAAADYENVILPLTREEAEKIKSAFDQNLIQDSNLNEVKDLVKWTHMVAKFRCLSDGGLEEDIEIKSRGKLDLRVGQAKMWLVVAKHVLQNSLVQKLDLTTNPLWQEIVKELALLQRLV